MMKLSVLPTFIALLFLAWAHSEHTDCCKRLTSELKAHSHALVLDGSRLWATTWRSAGEGFVQTHSVVDRSNFTDSFDYLVVPLEHKWHFNGYIYTGVRAALLMLPSRVFELLGGNTDGRDARSKISLRDTSEKTHVEECKEIYECFVLAAGNRSVLGAGKISFQRGELDFISDETRRSFKAPVTITDVVGNLMAWNWTYTANFEADTNRRQLLSDAINVSLHPKMHVSVRGDDPAPEPSPSPPPPPTPSPTRSPTPVPSRRPTSFPTSPSGIPTGEPTGEPTGMPSGQPTTIPSEIPTSVPSSMPSGQPSGEPSGVPSTTPTNVPSTTPTRVPTAAPSTTPTATPTSVPSVLPTSVPSGAPTALPTSTPTNVPTSVPSTFPSESPTALPTSVPTAVPSITPTTCPTSVPSVVPSSVPSYVPSTIPTSVPSVVPSTVPTTVPSSVPSTSVPSTSWPSGEPTTYPTNSLGEKNTYRPSTVPTAMPWTSNPTSAPTLTGQSQLLVDLRELLQDVSTGILRPNTTRIVTGSSIMSAEWLGHSLLPEDMCEAYSGFYSEMMSFSLKYQVRAMTLTTRLGRDPSNVEHHECLKEKSVQRFIDALLSKTTLINENCEGKYWEVRRCSRNGMVACVGLDCSYQICSSTRTRHSLFYPCARSDEGDSNDPGNLSIFRLSYRNRGIPIVVDGLLLETSVDRQGVVMYTLEVTTSWGAKDLEEGSYSKKELAAGHPGGLVYCKLYLQGSVPKSVPEIIFWNQVADVLPSAATSLVRLSQPLEASTSYDTFCATKSNTGVDMELTKVLAAKQQVKTACCKRLDLSLKETFLRATHKQQLGSLAISVDALPSKTLYVNVWARSSNGTAVHPFEPRVLVFAPDMSVYTRTLSFSGFAAVGDYTLMVDAYGKSGPEFGQGSYWNGGDSEFSGTVFTVLPAADPLPPPSNLTAYFAPDASHVVVDFGVLTNRAGLPSGRAPCSRIFNMSVSAKLEDHSSSTGEQDCEVKWIDDKVLALYHGGILPGMGLTLRNDVEVKAYCSLPQPQRYICKTQWTASGVLNATISYPMKANVPLVDIKAPDSVGICNPVIIDSSGSSGSGGRAWLSSTTSISTTDVNRTRLAFLGDALHGHASRERISIPSRVWGEKMVYVVRVEKCNFLGVCGLASHTFSVLPSIFESVPAVTILGSRSRAIYADQVLEAEAQSYKELCSGERFVTDLRFTWSVTNSATQTVMLVSTDATKNPAKLRLLPYTLEAGSVYYVRAQVKSTGDDSIAFSGITVVVLQRPLTSRVFARPFDAQYRVAVRASEEIVLDGSASFDPDVGSELGSLSNVHLQFSWSCVQLLPENLPNCPSLWFEKNTGYDPRTNTWRNLDNFRQVSVTPAPISIPPESSDDPESYSVSNVTLLVRSQDGTRSSLSFMIVEVVSDMKPMVKAIHTSVGSGVKLDVRHSLVLDAVVATGGAPVEVEWSVEPEIANLHEHAIGALKHTTRSTNASDSSGVSGGVISFFLKLPRGALASRTNYVFSLSSLDPRSGFGDSAQVPVTTNGEPLPGSFIVTPSDGLDYLTMFKLDAKNWEDEDLPLYYTFGVTDALSGQRTLLRAPNEIAWVRHMLKSGDEDSDFAVTVYCDITDVLGAVAFSEERVRVRPQWRNASADHFMGSAAPWEAHLASVERFVDDRFAGVGLEDIKANPMLIPEIQASIGVAIAAINQVNCTDIKFPKIPQYSGLSSCLDLHRRACARTAHTCGACLPGYVGQAGDANSLCIAYANATAELVKANLDSIRQECTSRCSDHGTCVYLSPHANGTTVANCTIGTTTCSPVCECAEGWVGSGCEYTHDELARRRTLKDRLLSYATQIFFDMEELLDSKGLKTAVSGVMSAVMRREELGNTTRGKVHRMLSNVVDAFATISVEESMVSDLLHATDVMLVPLDMNSTRSYARLVDTTNSTSVTENIEAISMIEKLSRYQASSMIPEEPQEETAARSFTLSTLVVQQRDEADEDGGGVSSGAALSSSYDALTDAGMSVNMTSLSHGARASGEVVPTYVARVDASVVAAEALVPTYSSDTLVAQGFGAHDVLSDGILFGVMGSSAPTSYGDACDYSGNSSMQVTFQLPLRRQPEPSGAFLKELQPVKHTLKCKKGVVFSKEVFCPGAPQNLVCDGSFDGTVEVVCRPFIQQEVTCQARLFPTAASTSDCRPVNTTLTHVHCACDVCALRRRLQDSGNDQSITIHVIAMGEFVVNDFVLVSTNFAPKGILERTRLVWLAIMCLIGAVILIFGTLELYTYGNEVRDQRRQAKLAQPDLISELRSMSTRGLLTDKTRGNNDNQDIVSECDDLDPSAVLERYIESLFPAVFSAKTTLERFLEELRSNHLLLVAIFDDDLEERLLSAYELLSVLLQGCFVVAMVTSLEMGNTKIECEAHTKKDTCLDDMSLQNRGETACLWDEEVLACSVNEVESDWLSFTMSCLLTVCIGIPLRIMHGLIFTGVLRAPTLGSGDKEDCDVEDADAEIAAQAAESYEDPNMRSIGPEEGIATVSTASTKSVQIRRKAMRILEKARRHSQRSSFRSSFGRDVKIPGHILELRRKVFYEPTLRRVKRVDVDNATVETLAQDLHLALVLYISECRQLGLSYSTDRHARRLGLNQAAIETANKSFQKAWNVSVVNALTAEPCTGIRVGDDEEYVNIQWHSWNDVVEVLEEVIEESHKVASIMEHYSGNAAGAELTRHLVLDLLGRDTLRAKIFDSKSSWHLKTTLVLPMWVKIMAYGASFVLNLYYIWMCILYGGAKGDEWQRAFLLFCALYILFSLTIEMTVEAIMIGFVIPCQVLSDIRALQAELSIRLNTREVFQLLLDHANGTIDANKPQSGDNDAISPLDSFSATHFFFVSSRVAKEFPGLPESVLVDVFRSAHPRMALVNNSIKSDMYGYQGIGSGVSQYKTALTKCFAGCTHIASFASVLLWIGGQSLVMQKIIINAPLPAISSILAASLYVTDADSSIWLAIVLSSGMVVLIFLTVWLFKGANLVIERSIKSDEEFRLEMNSRKGAYKQSISAFGVAPDLVHRAPVLKNPDGTGPGRRRSIIFPDFDEERAIKFELLEKQEVILRKSLAIKQEKQKNKLKKRLQTERGLFNDDDVGSDGADEVTIQSQLGALRDGVLNDIKLKRDLANNRRAMQYRLNKRLMRRNLASSGSDDDEEYNYEHDLASSESESDHVASSSESEAGADESVVNAKRKNPRKEKVVNVVRSVKQKSKDKKRVFQAPKGSAPKEIVPFNPFRDLSGVIAEDSGKIDAISSFKGVDEAELESESAPDPRPPITTSPLRSECPVEIRDNHVEPKRSGKKKKKKKSAKLKKSAKQIVNMMRITHSNSDIVEEGDARNDDFKSMQDSSGTGFTQDTDIWELLGDNDSKDSDDVDDIETSVTSKRQSFRKRLLSTIPDRIRALSIQEKRSVIVDELNQRKELDAVEKEVFFSANMEDEADVEVDATQNSTEKDMQNEDDMPASQIRINRARLRSRVTKRRMSKQLEIDSGNSSDAISIDVSD